MSLSRAMADDTPVEVLNLTAPSAADVEAAYRALSKKNPAINSTICGIHHQLADAIASMPEAEREHARRLLAIAYVMGKKMYYKLREYQRASAGDR